MRMGKIPTGGPGKSQALPHVYKGNQGRAQDFSQVWAEFFRNKKQKSGT